MNTKSRTTSLAKITRPSLAAVLARDQLFHVLDERNPASVLWVWGPPGSGKTTLVASYLESRGIDSRWYQLDRGDSDVATFFYYMGLAAQATGGKSDEPLPLFTSEYRHDQGAFSRRYFQSLYETLEPRFVLVLDSYQDIGPESQFHAVVSSAVGELPPEGCIIIISRSQPPPSMARLRANQSLQMLGWNELRLSREESDEIVALWGAELDEPALDRIYQKTQGWPAGLILMLDQAMAEGSNAAPPDVSAPQVIFEYLAGEVFQNFDESTRQLLLKTAFLPEITPPMADELTGSRDSSEILARLHRGNYYVTMKSGASGPVYQYHPLLQEFLSARASESLSEHECQEIRRTSAKLLEVQGNVEESASLLCYDQSWDELMALVFEHAAEMLHHGRAETLEHWLDEFPSLLLEREPWLQYWRAACRFLTSPRESRLLYERAFELFKARKPVDTRGLLLTCAGAMDSIIYELDDFSLLDRWIEETSRLLADSPEVPWPEVECRITVSLFMSLVFRQPHHPDMKHWADRAMNLSQSLSDTMTRMGAQLLVAINLNYTGQFDKARDLVTEMRRACKSPDVTPLALTVLKDIESMHYMLTGDRESCLQAVYDGVEVAETNGVEIWKAHLLSNGVGGALGSGDLDSAADLLEQMRDGQMAMRRVDQCNYHYYSAWLAMLRDDVVGAHQGLKTALRLANEIGCPFYVILCRLALAQVLAELGDEHRAASHLRQIHESARRIDNRLLEYSSLLAYAHIALSHGRERSGLNSLRYAMGLGRENGFTHFLWWRPAMMANLCARALESGIEVDYVRELVRQRGLMPDEPPLDLDDWPWSFRIRSFGSFEILKNGKPLGFFARLQGKPMELLKGLVGLGGENVQEMTLAESIWPRIDGDYAQRSLTTTLHRLRKLLGEDKTIALKNSRLSIDTRSCWLDVRAFEQVANRIDGLLKHSHHTPTADDVGKLKERLLDIYRGPFMASEGDNPRYVGLRERLRTKFIRCIGVLARYFEDQCQWEQAVDCYLRSLEADTHAESFYRRLMICYRKLGRQAEAVDVYDACKRVFNAELRVDPSDETTAVYQNLLREL
jgi:ATP/maltotriose-dependent transcriptional regulator MalT/DNA-binding SARP family transcriptional activator